MNCDLAIVGGGAVGLATAMALAQDWRADVMVLEAEPALAAHQTGHNSGVIHSGLYYRPGSLKARLCTSGRELLYRFCAEHGVPHERCGKVIVAVDEAELSRLEQLLRRGAANGLADLRLLSIEQLREHEPHVAGLGGSFVRETGIVDFAAVARKYAQVVQSAGGRVLTGARVLSVERPPGRIILHTTRGQISCRGLVNCAGLQSDRIARMCGIEPKLRIIPFRGEYFTLAPEARHLVRNLIYPVPDPGFPFLGVHFTRMIGGGVEAGPNALLALARHGYEKGRINFEDLADILTYPAFWKMAAKYWRMGAGEMYRSISRRASLRALQRLLPELALEHLAPGGAGVRAQALADDGTLLDDFRIEAGPGMIHVLNAPSPAATASIAIGRHIAGMAAGPLGLEGVAG
jgi:(S)-2-hydroxyglutarate dehydrogenase